MENQQFTAEQIKALYDQGVFREKHDLPAGLANIQPAWGDNGFLNTSVPTGQYAYDLALQPQTFLDALPVEPTQYEKHTVEILTGVTDTTGTNPADYCGDPITVGDLKRGNFANELGDFFIGSRKIQLPKVGLKQSPADQGLQIRNAVRRGDRFIPAPLLVDGAKLDSPIAMMLWSLRNSIRKLISRIAVTGDQTQPYTATDPGWIKEFDGLANLVKTGYLSTTGTAIPGADSLVETWGAAADATVGGINLSQLVHEIAFSRTELAAGLGMEGYWGALVGPRAMFYRLLNTWACTYANARCGDGTAGQPQPRDVTSIENRFIEMRRGQYLLIDGSPVPFLFTDGTEATVAAGTYTGSLFYVPMAYDGGSLTRLAYADLSLPNDLVTLFNDEVTLTNNNMYMMTTVRSNLCARIELAARLRLELDTPFLAARIDGISYTNYRGYRDQTTALGGDSTLSVAITA